MIMMFGLQAGVPILFGRCRRVRACSGRVTRACQAAGGPTAGLSSYPGLTQTLSKLLRGRGISQRELARRAPDLQRSTLGAMLRGERTASRNTVMAIVRACGVSAEAEQAWPASWWQLGSPRQQRRRRARYAGYSYSLDRGTPWG